MTCPYCDNGYIQETVEYRSVCQKCHGTGQIETPNAAKAAGEEEE